MGLNDIRQAFLTFFEKQDHHVESSFPLVPQNDKSLLLVNAGMAPLKPYFTGAKVPPKPRMATCQKCLRTADIDNVGHTSRHGTFFEMLGNFSFGDYFKKESILWGWTFLTEVLEIPVDKLWPSVYHEDDEAFFLWRDNIGIPEEKIIRLGKEDNFWEIGVGPCGPCSEIYFDRGKDYGCEDTNCLPGCDCDRFIEIWNHVFTQFEKTESGEYIPLAQKNIDTGMGLERIACVMQDVDSIFEVDTIKHILDAVAKLAQKEYGKDHQTDVSLRIITDHMRAVTFLISDGVMPNNEGRGYVLRRLLRRAARHGKKLGIQGSFLTALVKEVVAVSAQAYPDLSQRQTYIESILHVEEERFSQTIDQGLSILTDWIKTLEEEKQKTLSGDKAFKLYDTYGFPLDLTREILSEKSIEVDEKAFEQAMKTQRERARSARKSKDGAGWEDDVFQNLSPETVTTFFGYETLCTKGKVLAIAADGEQVSFASVGQKVQVILDRTPFYAESGGQVGDQGLLCKGDLKIEIFDTTKGIYGTTIHSGKIVKGKLHVGDEVLCQVNETRRLDIGRNHTATHLLHKALKTVLGDHVRQAGSLVAPERMRFDITHFQAITEEEIQKIEAQVNEDIFTPRKVKTQIMSLDEAKEKGAVALFGEKYGQTVRVVDIENVSKELCGGTHLQDTAQVGVFKIISEGGIAAGVRRIEVVTGRFAYAHMCKMDRELSKVSKIVKAPVADAVSKILQWEQEIKTLQKTVQSCKEKMAGQDKEKLLSKVRTVGSFEVVCEALSGVDTDTMRALGDQIKDQLKNGVVVLANVVDQKVLFLVMANDEAVKAGAHAGKLVSTISKIAKGGGGGRPHMAQAGGKDPSKVEEALKKAIEILSTDSKL